MKKVTTLALLGLLTLAMGQDISVDQQIENIKNASAQDRVKLMNEFKQKMVLMNQQERAQVISKMQKSMNKEGYKSQNMQASKGSQDKAQNGNTKQNNNEEYKGKYTQDMKKEHIQQSQMENSQQMQYMQYSNQKQTVDQWHQEGGQTYQNQQGSAGSSNHQNDGGGQKWY